MNYEKKYKEAIERAKRLHSEPTGGTERIVCEQIFPELKEGEDERIRKEFCKDIWTFIPNEKAHKYITWLEKQGKQKPTDNVEPKFHEGEWVTDGYIGGQITSIEDNYSCYKISSFTGNINISVPLTLQDNYHLWTLQDAKDGDVLCYKDEISLFKHEIIDCTKQTPSFGGLVYYCCYDGKRFITNSMYSLTEQDKEDIHPATKEQRDTLFAKMKEAGYEWDAEKKELKKIKPKTLDSDKVIEWLDEHVPTKFEDMQNYVEQFKKDFGL